jgi:hypothetical protein
MQSLQLIQQLNAVTVVTFMIALPWLAVMAMHAFSAQTRTASNDAWNVRADAAVRWTRAAVAQTSVRTANVVKFNARRSTPVNINQAPVLHAA